MPQVSVVMSVYNGERYLAPAIDSILKQSFSDFELLIIDDASEDGTAQLLEDYAARDPRIKIHRNPANKGLTWSLNRALELAQGTYIARQDADDVSLPRRLEYQVEYLDEHEGVELCGSFFEYLDEQGQVFAPGPEKWWYFPEEVAQVLPQENPFVHSSICFRNRGHRYREKFRYTQDYDLYLRLLSEGYRMVNLREVLVQRRISFSALSYRNRPRQWAFTEHAQRFYKERDDLGGDSYEIFDPQEVMALAQEKHAERMAVEDQLKLLLKTHQFDKARSFYAQKYRSLSHRRLTTDVALWGFVHVPVLYRLYRRLRYA